MTQYFSNASQTNINNLTISHVNGNALSIGRSERQGLRLLLENISRGAFHDAAERGDPPKCHPDTRVAIREEIMEWIQAPGATRKLILWMYGPAGAGKTAIGQSIAEECKKRGLLAASFFFSRTAAGRNDTTRVVATIAYQISRFLPQIENHLFTAIKRDPAIFSCTLATQMQVLVVEPLKALPASRQKQIFVILDGIDEIGPDAQSQATLLDIIGTAISELQHIPLIFLIASRPEYEIREAFDGPLLHSFTRTLELDDHYNPDADIKLYFNSMFRQIHDKHLRLGTRLPSPWPSESDVDRLVSKASGQFIFASTVMKFVDSVRLNPAKQLDIIMGLSAAGSKKPFALLDVLYRHILSSVADLPQVLEILMLLLLNRAPDAPELTVKLIVEVLGIEVRRALVDMHALIFVPPLADGSSAVRIHHASLFDFLVNRSRSQEYYIDKTQGHITLGRRWLKTIGNGQLSDEISLWRYFSSFIYHSLQSPANSEITDDLVYFNLKVALEKMTIKHGDQIVLEINWSKFFDCVEQLVKITWKNFFVSIGQRFGDRADVLARLQRELLAFIIESISKYPQALRDSIPTILVLGYPSYFFDMLTRAEGLSLGDVYKSGDSDSELLNLSDIYWCYDIFRQLFEDRSLAGCYYVHSGSYLTLAKQIVTVMFPRLPGGGQKVLSRETRSQLRIMNDDYKHILDGLRLSSGFVGLLSKASNDFDLARVLHNRALQYNRSYPKDKANVRNGDESHVALASLVYIQKCGLPYLEHTHPEGTNACIICTYFGDGSDL